MDEGVRKGARRGHKGCLCFQQRSDLRNAPLGLSRELPTANNALNVSSGWLAQTPLALLQGPGSSEMMEHREPYTSGVPHLPSQKDGRADLLWTCTATKGFQSAVLIVLRATPDTLRGFLTTQPPLPNILSPSGLPAGL